MKKLFVLAALLFPSFVSAAISGTAVQCVEDTALSGTSITIDSGDGWSTPTTGNLLVAYASSDGNNGGLPTITWPSGFTEIQSSYTDGFRASGGVAWDVAASETSFTFTIANEQDETTAVVCEFSATDLDLSAVDASNENAALIDTNSTSIGTNGATNTTNDALVIASLHNRQSNSWTSTSLSNSFVSQHDSGEVARAGIQVATKVVSSAASQSTTFSTTDSGTKVYATVIVFASSTATTVWTDDTVDVGTTIQGTLTVAFSGAITKCVFASGDELVASNADTDSADCAQTKADFLSGGSLSNTRIAAATTASLDNASETSTADTFTFNSPDDGVTDHFGTSGNASPDPDSLYSNSDFTTEYASFDSNADDVWVTVSTGACDFEPVEGIFECTVVPATGVVRVYDVSATDWLTESTWSVVTPGGGCQTDVVLTPLVRPIVYSPITQIFCN